MRNAVRLKCLVFDFDGTLARPSLDFALMKARVTELARPYPGARPECGGLPALELVVRRAASMDEASAAKYRAAAHAAIREMEARAAASTSLFGFVRPALARLRARGVAPAVITRNTRDSVLAVFPEALEVLEALFAREDVPAVKPDPGHLLAALRKAGAAPGQAMMVGDHPSDVLTARRAGTLAGAVASGGTPREELALSRPDYLARDAGELLERLEELGLA